MKRTVIDILKKAAEKYPDSKYLGEKTDNGWQTLNIKQADQCSDYFAVSLVDFGYKAGVKWPFFPKEEQNG